MWTFRPRARWRRSWTARTLVDGASGLGSFLAARLGWRRLGRRSPSGEQKAKIDDTLGRFSISSGCSKESRARAWPKLSDPASTRAWTDAGNLNRRKKLATVARSLPVAHGHLLLGHVELARERSKARACSMGLRSARWRFSTMVISMACSSETWRRMAGMVVLPASSEARHGARRR